jgi:hypothetical protein
MPRKQSRVTRRDFARFLALSGSVLLPHPLLAWPPPLQQTPERPDETFWLSVRQQFLMPPGLGVLNAANPRPSPAPVLEAMYRATKDMVDGACTFGMLDLDLTDVQPDFFTGSAHKWPCGPKEVGVLYVNARAQGRIHRASSTPIRARSASHAPWKPWDSGTNPRSSASARHSPSRARLAAKPSKNDRARSVRR